jgi:hypothetical protein
VDEPRRFRSWQDALSAIKMAARLRQLKFTDHALERMGLRGATRKDVREALLTSSLAEWSDYHEAWLVSGGVDSELDELRVAVSVLHNGAVVVTVLGEE